MSGHSKWSTIKRKKGANDAKKGAIFTKLAKELTVAAKIGGGNPDMNVRLRLAIQKAREANMPIANIDRAVKRGTGESGEAVQYEELVYEGYGAAGVAVLVDVTTDNRNRASSDIRHIFSKHGGNLGETGCVGWIFETKGLITVDVKGKDQESIQLEIIDGGAEDVNETEEAVLEVISRPENFESLKGLIERKGLTVLSSEITKVPKNTIKIEDEKTAKQLISLLETLEDNEDVQKAYANFDIDEQLMNALST